MPEPAWVESIVEAWEGRLVVYASRLLGGDVDRARDVVQDVFLKLWRQDQSSLDGHVGPWLYAVCRNRSLDVRRKERRMTTSGDTGVIERIGPDGETPPAADADTPTGLIALVDRLPERQQEAVRLRFQGGLSYRDIAEVMDTTTSNVGVLLHTAIRRLREWSAECAGAAQPGRADA